jgi:hypothetical protein
MARGWESKAIEAQQEDATQSRRASGREPSAAEQAEGARRHTLELARARAVADLSRATTPAHREMLERAIADLDRQLITRRGTG